MGRALLTAEQFSRVVVTRVRRERPDIRVKTMGAQLLLIEGGSGRQRVVSLEDLYQSYCEAPAERDETIATFLAALVYEEPRTITGTFADNRANIMPQVVPPTLVEFCRREQHDLAAVDYVGGLSVAFVLDEDERYAYIHRDLMEDWGVTVTTLLMAAIENLQRRSKGVGQCRRFGRGERVMVVWELFDGYDASRILLKSVLLEAATMVPGNPVIAVPHRDYMVMFGDADPAFVAEMGDRIREDFDNHSYPITHRLLTLDGGNLVPYEGTERRSRIVN